MGLVPSLATFCQVNSKTIGEPLLLVGVVPQRPKMAGRQRVR